MYETHFGLRQRPFPAVADSDYYYPATSHERALAQLQQAIEDDECFALLIGKPGTGKTKLCHGLLDRLGETVSNAFLTHSRFPNRASLLQALLYDFSLPHEGRSEQELRLALADFLLKNHQAGRRTLVVVDEAQHLGPDLLEELRLLGNLEGRTGRAFQAILAAQPAILDTLRLPELAALSQRMAVCARLEPLGMHEAADYLVHHLRAAGGKPERIISDEALEILARGTRGVPRLLNRAIHQALTLAFAAGAALVDAEAALESLGSLGLGEGEEVPIASANPLEPTQEQNEVSEIEASSKPALALQDGGEENQRRTALSLPDPGASRRPFASPRRPA
jgi:type II secretory pathway predicted ATPase ExeA